MSNIAGEADFLRCDITYDDCKKSIPMFNAVAFDRTTMEWVVVARIRLDCKASAGYRLCYKKNCFNIIMCRSINENFELGVTLQGIVTDWSVAVIRGLK